MIDQYLSLNFAMTPMISIQTQTALVAQLPQLIIAAIHGDGSALSDGLELLRSLVNNRVSLEAFRLNPYALLKDAYENLKRKNVTAGGIDLYFAYIATMGLYQLAKSYYDRGARRITQSRKSFEGFDIEWQEIPASRLVADPAERSASTGLDKAINGTSWGLNKLNQAVDYSIHPYDLIKKISRVLRGLRGLTSAQKEFLDDFNKMDSEIISEAPSIEDGDDAFEGMIKTALADKKFDKEFQINLVQKNGEAAVKVTKNDMLDKFIASHADTYRYDDATKTLAIKGEMSELERIELLGIFSSTQQKLSRAAKNEIKAIYELFNRSRAKAAKSVILTSSDIIKIALDPKYKGAVKDAMGGAVSDWLAKNVTPQEKKALVESLRASGEKVKKGMKTAELEGILNKANEVDRKSVAVMKEREFLQNLDLAADYCKYSKRNKLITMTNDEGVPVLRMTGEDFLNLVRVQILQFKLDNPARAFNYDVMQPHRKWRNSIQEKVYNKTMRSIYEHSKDLYPIEEIKQYYPDQFESANGDPEACNMIYESICENIIGQQIPDVRRFVQQSAADKILLIEGIKLSEIMPRIRKGRYNALIGRGLSWSGKTVKKVFGRKTPEPAQKNEPTGTGTKNDPNPNEKKVEKDKPINKKTEINPEQKTASTEKSKEETKSKLSTKPGDSEKKTTGIKQEKKADTNSDDVNKKEADIKQKDNVHANLGPAVADNIYTVVDGDRMWSIARKYGTTVKKLLELNPEIKDSTKIKVGQKIRLPEQRINNVGGSQAGAEVTKDEIDAIINKSNSTDVNSYEQAKIDEVIETLKSKNLLFKGMEEKIRDGESIKFKKVSKEGWGDTPGDAVYRIDENGKCTIYLKETVFQKSCLDRLIRVFYRGFGNSKLIKAMLHETAETHLRGNTEINLSFEGNTQLNPSEITLLNEENIHLMAKQIEMNGIGKAPNVKGVTGKPAFCVVTTDGRVAKMVEGTNGVKVDIIKDSKAPRNIRMGEDGLLHEFDSKGNPLGKVTLFEKDGVYYKKTENNRVWKYTPDIENGKWNDVTTLGDKAITEIKTFGAAAAMFVVVGTMVNELAKLAKGEKVDGMIILKDAAGGFAGLTLFYGTTKLVEAAGGLSSGKGSNFTYVYQNFRTWKTPEDVVKGVGGIAGFTTPMYIASKIHVPGYLEYIKDGFALGLGLILQQKGEDGGKWLSEKFTAVVDNPVVQMGLMASEIDREYNPAEIIAGKFKSPVVQGIVGAVGTALEWRVVSAVLFNGALKTLGATVSLLLLSQDLGPQENWGTKKNLSDIANTKEALKELPMGFGIESQEFKNSPNLQQDIAGVLLELGYLKKVGNKINYISKSGENYAVIYADYTEEYKTRIMIKAALHDYINDKVAQGVFKPNYIDCQAVGNEGFSKSIYFSPELARLLLSDYTVSVIKLNDIASNSMTIDLKYLRQCKALYRQVTDLLDKAGVLQQAMGKYGIVVQKRANLLTSMPTYQLDKLPESKFVEVMSLAINKMLGTDGKNAITQIDADIAGKMMQKEFDEVIGKNVAANLPVYTAVQDETIPKKVYRVIP